MEDRLEMQNPKNQIQNYNIHQYKSEDEIDLYDLIEILVKNRVIILFTTVLVTLGSGMAAFKVNSDYQRAEKNRIENIEKGEIPQLTKLNETKAELETLENELKIAVEKETSKYTNAEGVSEIINLKNSGLIREIKEKTEEYNRAKTAYGAISEPAKNRAKLILAVGMVLGLFMGIFLAFVKEFIEGYKKREKKN